MTQLHQCTAGEVIKNLLSSLPQENETRLSFEEQIVRYEQAQAILKMAVFKETSDKMIKDLIEETVMKSENWEQVIGIRLAIIGIRNLIERLSKIEDPRKKETKQEIYEAI